MHSSSLPPAVNASIEGRKRLAIVVSHPIQYYAPLYQRLALRDDLCIRVYFTWHGGENPVQDRGFAKPFAWDIPITGGYDFEVVPNTSADPGTHSFFGLKNPDLVERILRWSPDVVHITGWAWLSHLQALRTLHRLKVPVLFRGDSHLMNAALSGPRWWAKRLLLRRIYSWPTAFLVVGSANREYYRAFGVNDERLLACPPSIDVGRFAQPAESWEREAAEWRRGLGISESEQVLLFAGKFEPTKQPLLLMNAMRNFGSAGMVLVLVGGGELEAEMSELAAASPGRFRILPFQNQSRMPAVYRLGDAFVLPTMGDSWGLAVNEALACGRPVLVSNRAGCAEDVVDGTCGAIFPWNDGAAIIAAFRTMTSERENLRRLGEGASERARKFDIPRTESSTAKAVLAAAVRR